MEVILIQDVRALGKKGQKVKVSDGYAKNYLLPKKLAIEANASNLNVLQTQKESMDYKMAKRKEQAEEQKKSIEGKVLEFHIKSGENGKLFGALTGKEIAEAIAERFNVQIDKKKITIPENIKTYGTYNVELKLFPDITAKIIVQVSE